MEIKIKHHFALIGMVGLATFLDALYLGHGFLACTDESQTNPYLFLGIVLFLIFTGLVLLAPLGQTTQSKLLNYLAKITLIIIFAVILFFTSFTLCF